MSSFAVESADCRTVFTERSNGDSRLLLPVRTADAVDDEDDDGGGGGGGGGGNVLGSPLAKTFALSGGNVADCGRSGTLGL
jgi:hypothetical protein